MGGWAMVQRIKVKFGTTEEALRKELKKLAEANGWDPSRVHYVLDVNACTVSDTVYAVSSSSHELPSHPSGPAAIMKLAP